jgi:ABC-type bacteriocin/lantibiotic exporter with double-glycine peptidase domain
VKRPRLLAPEIVQTSSMDCGPATLKCVLEGFGIQVSYGRLREACQTDVDGSSIDTMEDVAHELGLDAEQVMVPVDHVLLPEMHLLPAIAVVRLSNGLTHFVVIWRRHGPFLQLMDPATGRRWIHGKRLLEELYVHTVRIPAADWHGWATSAPFVRSLLGRLARIGAPGSALLNSTLADSGWWKLAILDASVRLLGFITNSGGVKRGRQANRLLERFCSNEGSIPAEYWSVRPCSSSPGEEERVDFRGAVLVHIHGCLEGAEPNPISPELAAALAERPTRPGKELLRLLLEDGVFTPAIVATLLLLATGSVVLEAVLFRGFFELSRELGLAGQRMGAVGALLAFLLLLLLLEYPLGTILLRWGRTLELRLRMAFLEKIPRLGDRYLKSRPMSDMAERCHSIHRIRHLPELAGQFVRGVFELALTAAGIAWVDSRSAPIAILAAAIMLGLPLMAHPIVAERDLRIRMHSGALSRFYLDALLGLVPIRVHGAERAVRGEHGKLLVEWAKAGFGLQRTVVGVEALQMVAGFGFAGWLLLDHLTRSGEGGGVLLLTYWALNLPVLGQEIAIAAWQYPANRNVTLRLFEPLRAIEETPPAEPSRPIDPAQSDGIAMAIEMREITVRAAGHTILEDVNLLIAAGTHVAIVGSSGAGKSSLVGLLLGWHRAAKGTLLVDGAPVSERLRRQIAWVDPSVHLWNRSLFENLRYGAPACSAIHVNDVSDIAELREVLQKLPEGFETRLGEGGGLLSGGEGQRVRLGRAMLRDDARLVILDEPFRGLDREQRGRLMARARGLWRHATLLCITHDIEKTLEFDRIVVIEGGRVVENGVPSELISQADSRYRRMLAAEDATRAAIWSSGDWRRVRLEQGEIRC